MNIFDISESNLDVKTVGIGLTNLCNLNCNHCYSRNMPEKSFVLADMERIISLFPNLESVNFGTGESILNNDFKKIVNLFFDNGIKVALTSNGLSVNMLDEETLEKFTDIDISLDFPSAGMHDSWRKKNGLFDEAIMAIKRCKKYDINVSIASVLMSNNYSYLVDFKKILDVLDVNLRINLYKSVNTDKFVLSYEEFWNVIEDISNNFEVISCSEPLLSLVYDDVKGGSRCGDSIRIHPDGDISSCVYLNGAQSNNFNTKKREVLEFCESCKVVDKCVGGCYGRRIIDNRETLPDMYCPIYNNKSLPQFKLNKKEGSSDLIHSNYLCTIILR